MSKIRREKRIRNKIIKNSDRPRLNVFRSNKYMYAQLIDKNGNAIGGLSEKNIEKKGKNRMENAREVGIQIASIAKSKKITKVVFDKGRFAYHGKVKNLAEGAREGGLQF